MMFRNMDAFKQHMALYSIEQKFRFRSMKSDPGLMILKYCGATYQWRVYAARLKESDVFEVRSLVRQHTCSINE